MTLATPGPGTVNLFGLSFDMPADLNAMQADSFVLATLVFRAVGAGLSPVGISAALLGDAVGDALPATRTSASIAVSGGSVPEPASVRLALLGAAALASKRHRHHAHSRQARQSSIGSAPETTASCSTCVDVAVGLLDAAPSRRVRASVGRSSAGMYTQERSPVAQSHRVLASRRGST